MYRQFLFMIALTANFAVADVIDSLNMKTLSICHEGYGYTAVTANVNSRQLLIVGSGSGFDVYDNAGSKSISHISDLSLPGMPSAIAVSGTHAYITVFNSGLIVVDLSNPDTPRAVGRIAISGTPECIAVQDSFAYVGEESGKLSVISVADPAHPALIGSIKLQLPGRFFGIAVSGSYGFAAVEDSGLRVIDLHSPDSPVFKAKLPVPICYGVVISGHIAYAACGDSGLVLLDIADPLNVRRTGSIVPAGEFVISPVFIQSNVYTMGANRFIAFSVADSSHPTLLKSMNLFQGGFQAAIATKTAYIPGTGQICVVDIGNPAGGMIEQPPILSYTGVKALTVSAGRLAAVYESGGIRIFNIHDQQSPKLYAAFDQTSLYSRCAFSPSGDTLIYACLPDTLIVTDIHDRLQLKGLSATIVGKVVNDIALHGKTACLALKDFGIALYDLSNATAPVRLGGITLPGTPVRVRFSSLGGLVYVACGDSGMSIVDIHDPAHPRIAGTYHMAAANASLLDIAISGNRAYLAGGYYGKLEVVSIADSSKPMLLGSYSSCFPCGVETRGDTVFVACGYYGTQVFDSKIPSQIQLIGWFSNSEFRYGSPINTATTIALGDSGLVVEGNEQAGFRLLRFADAQVAVQHQFKGSAVSTFPAMKSGEHFTLTLYGLDGRVLLHKQLESGSSLDKCYASVRIHNPLIMEIRSPSAIYRCKLNPVTRKIRNSY